MEKTGLLSETKVEISKDSPNENEGGPSNTREIKKTNSDLALSLEEIKRSDEVFIFHSKLEL